MDAPQYEVKKTPSHRSNDSRSSEKGPPSMLETPDPLIVSLEFLLLDVLHLNQGIHLALESTKGQEQLVVHDYGARPLTRLRMM
jgi:hypothetical protein